MPTINPLWLGVLRALGTVILLAIVHFFANAANLHGLLNDSLSALVAMIAMGIEHQIESSTGNALFGAIRTR